MTAAVAPSTTTTPEIRQIPASALMVDRTVQRGLETTRAERIAQDFDRSALGTFVVSRRADGTNHLIDGQHRHAVVIMLGGDDWLLNCEVHEGLTRAQEARMFRLLNNSKAVNVLDKFLVRIQEGDPVAVGINTILERYGWTVALSKNTGTFVAVSAIEKPYRRAGDQGAQLVDWVINVCTQVWGHSADGVRNEIVTGLSLLWLRHRDAIDTAKLIAELQGFVGGARGLVGRARSLKEFRGGTIGDAMAEHLTHLVNSKRRINRLPSWRDTEEE
jgi:hypothetical protein